MVAFGTAGAATAYTRLQGNIDSADVSHLLGEDRPTLPAEVDPDDPNSGGPVNILVMGSDSRADGVVQDGTEGERSDTTLVLHLSADRQRIDVVSIPRDSLVDIPECLRSDGSTSSAQRDAMFNSAFSIGGESGEVTDAAACTQKTVEATTGVYIHHFVVVDMAGFINMIDALGGVPMCIPQDMYSRKAHLDLQAGNQVLDGTTALAFARARTGEGVGDGSDTNRIGRQQELIAATARTVLSKNLLTDVPELIRFLNAATRSLTVSSGISAIPDMAGLAFSARTVPSGNITLMTVPFAAAPSDPNRVVWTDEAQTVWENMANDRPLVETAAPAETPAATPAPSATTPEPTTPAAEPTEPATETPAPAETPVPGVDPFTADDLTSVCG